MEEKLKDKVREIQHKYCAESVETKLYHAIEEGIKIGKSTFKPIFDIKFKADSFDYPDSQSD